MSASKTAKEKYANAPFISRDTHYRRVEDLLEANNAYLERARSAEAFSKTLEQAIQEVIEEKGVLQRKIMRLIGENVDLREIIQNLGGLDRKREATAEKRSWWQRLRSLAAETQGGLDT